MIASHEGSKGSHGGYGRRKEKQGKGQNKETMIRKKEDGRIVQNYSQVPNRRGLNNWGWEIVWKLDKLDKLGAFFDRVLTFMVSKWKCLHPFSMKLIKRGILLIKAWWIGKLLKFWKSINGAVGCLFGTWVYAMDNLPQDWTPDVSTTCLRNRNATKLLWSCWKPVTV